MFEAEVKKGSAWLDQVSPGWYRSVDLNDLTLLQYAKCSLGQTLGANVSKHLCDDIGFSEPHGFHMHGVAPTIVRKRTWFGYIKEIQVKETPEQKEKRFSLLTSAWIQEILRRRSAESVMKNAIVDANTK